MMIPAKRYPRSVGWKILHKFFPEIFADLVVCYLRAALDAFRRNVSGFGNPEAWRKAEKSFFSSGSDDSG